MQNVRKTVVLLFVAVLGAMLANVSAHAQETSLSVNVPFEFVVGQHALGAGIYRVHRDGEFLSLHDAEGHSVFVLLQPGNGVNTQVGTPYLEFRRLGGEAFLNKVVFSENRNYDLPQSSREKEVLSKAASGEQVAVEMQ